MLNTEHPILVMGLLDEASIACAIGERIEAAGGSVIYTAQNEILTARYLDGVKRRSMNIRFCDVTSEAAVSELFDGLPTLGGIVHSIAYANPKTLLGKEFHTEAIDDILRSYHTSSVSLATVTRHAPKRMPSGGSVVAMTFDSSHAYPSYNWMGVHKAALEAIVRALARRHGRDRIRVNAVSAGPVSTKASSKIPGFGRLTALWNDLSPLPWDPDADKKSVADTVVFLLGNGSRSITGQVLTVDGGASAMGDILHDFERRPE